MACELVLMSKDKYDSQMISCLVTKNINSQQTCEIKTTNNPHSGDSTFWWIKPIQIRHVVDLTNTTCSGLDKPFVLWHIAICHETQRKAHGLLEHLCQHGGNTIKLNHKGHFKVNGEVMFGSNIGEIVCHAMCSKTVYNAASRETFYQALRTVDTAALLVAYSCFMNNARQAVSLAPQKGHGYIVRNKRVTTSVFSTQETSKTEIKWLKLYLCVNNIKI